MKAAPNFGGEQNVSPVRRRKSRNILTQAKLKIALTCIIPVYHRTDASEALRSIDSIVTQTYKADEIIVAIDGPISEQLRREIKTIQAATPNLKVIGRPNNSGLAQILNFAISQSKGDFIARMDSDDISAQHRFETQISEIVRHDLDLIGSTVTEVSKRGRRKKPMPLLQEEIIRYSRSRNPFNHPTVIFKKSLWEAVGGYHDVPYFEDYDLWLRMLSAGASTRNIDEPLVEMVMEYDDFRRRHGFSYAKHELEFVFRQVKGKTFSANDGLQFALKRTPSRFLPYHAFHQLVAASRRWKSQ